jgi:hypothetical protein
MPISLYASARAALCLASLSSAFIASTASSNRCWCDAISARLRYALRTCSRPTSRPPPRHTVGLFVANQDE